MVFDEEINDRVTAAGKAILSQPFGGLGDNLQFSTLPELYYRKGIQCYISSQNKYRNDEIYDIVWKTNPYVAGISDEEPTAGFPVHLMEGRGFGPQDKRGIITAWEILHGFEQRRSFQPPSVFYTPTIKPELSDKIVVDLGCSTLISSYNPDKIKSFLEKNFDHDTVLGLKKESKPDIHSTVHIQYDMGIIQYKLYTEYMDIICSCKSFVCLYSGSSVLASALNINKLFNVYCLFQYPGPVWYNLENPAYLFDNIKYRNLLIDSQMII
jgi:hypothetical protein